MNSAIHTKPLSRRRLLQRAAKFAAGIGLFHFVPDSALGKNERTAAGERITVAFIGVGRHGIRVNLPNFLAQPDAQVVAVCDVDDQHLERAYNKVNDYYANNSCSAYKDFRRVIDRNDIDAVMISTPDHWHVPIAVAAARAGKDVECEKPTLTVAEGRILCDTIQRHSRVFQMSTEDRSVYVYHRMAELVRNNRIGKLHTIRVTLPDGPHHDTRQRRDTKPQPVPQGFDYDMWLGPAPYKPYAPGRCHRDFRWIFDYSGGKLTDWGAHLFDTAQWANDTEHTGPVEVEGKGIFPPDGLYDTATQFHIEYKYENGVGMIVDSGGVAIRFEGTEGWVANESWCGPLKASSKKILDSEFGPNDIQLYTCPAGEQRNFLDCVRSRKKPYFHAETGHRCCTIAHIGNISMLLGRKLRWNPDEEKFVHEPRADRMLSRSMRSPWHL